MTRHLSLTLTPDRSLRTTAQRRSGRMTRDVPVRMTGTGASGRRRSGGPVS